MFAANRPHRAAALVTILACALAATASGGAATMRSGVSIESQPWPAIPQQAVTFRLRPAAGVLVSGTATLVAVGRGTKVSPDVSGLPPGAHASSRLHAGTGLTRLSASLARLPTLTARGTGKAKAVGRVLFNGREEVRLSAVADSRHVIVVVVGCSPALGRAAAPLLVCVRSG